MKTLSNIMDYNGAFPVAVMPKIDGYRARIFNSVVYTKSGKVLPNPYIQSVLGKSEFNGLEGELTSGNSFKDCGIIRSHHSEPFEFTFTMFNRMGWDAPWQDWIEDPATINMCFDFPFIKRVDYMVAFTKDELLSCEDKMRTDEGCMLRELTHEPTVSVSDDKLLYKVKFYLQDEGKIVGFEPEYYGTRLKTVPEELWGKPKNRIGKLILEGLPGGRFAGKRIVVGTGLSHDQKSAAWNMWEEEWEGNVATFKYVHSGTQQGGLPRHPVFIGLRPNWDFLSEKEGE
jgi:hypothetical protein